MMMVGDQRRNSLMNRFPYVGQLIREWLLLELLGHGGLIVLRQVCGTWWSWTSGGPFAYLDVSRAMLHGDAFWVVAVVGTSAIRSGLLAEWGHLRASHCRFGKHAWLTWMVPGCILGWTLLIRNDDGATYILALPFGWIFEGYHILFFGYVAARIVACAVQLASIARLLLHRSRRALATDGPWPYFPVGLGVVIALVLSCAAIYLHIYQQGGSFQARWEWFAREQV